jgi:hypothetical protein
MPANADGDMLWAKYPHTPVPLAARVDNWLIPEGRLVTFKARRHPPSKLPPAEPMTERASDPLAPPPAVEGGQPIDNQWRMDTHPPPTTTADHCIGAA